VLPSYDSGSLGSIVVPLRRCERSSTTLMRQKATTFAPSLRCQSSKPDNYRSGLAFGGHPFALSHTPVAIVHDHGSVIPLGKVADTSINFIRAW